MGKRIIIGALIVVVLALAFVLVSNQTAFVSLPKSDETTKIGFIVSQTGKYAVGGEESLLGLLLAEKEINAKGGINGRKLRVIVEDDKSEPKDAVSAFQKLVNVDGAKILIGGQISDIALATAPLAEKEKVLFLASTATAGALVNAGEYIFMFQAGNEAHAEKITGAMKNLGYKKIGLIFANAEYCKDMVGYLKKEFAKKRIEAVAEEAYETTALDMKTQLLKLQAANPEAVFLCGYYEDQARVIKQARELGIEKQFFAVTTIENEKFLEIAGKAAEGVIYTGTTFSCDTAKDFCMCYEKEFGKKATYRSAYLYDALFLIAKAIEKAGADPEALKRELLKTDYIGIAGKVVFDEQGNAKREFALKKVENGMFVFSE